MVRLEQILEDAIADVDDFTSSLGLPRNLEAAWTHARPSRAQQDSNDEEH